ncbi:hypothetical protein ACX82Z_15160 [Aliihoeflea sp. PC F10.4]
MLGEDSALAISLLVYVTSILVAYLILRDNLVWLYFARHIEFQAPNWPFALIVGYIIVLPLTYLFCRRAEADLFALILLPLVLIGGVSGSIVLAFSGDFARCFLFLLYFIAMPTLLSTIRVPTVDYPRIRMGRRGDGIFIVVGIASLVLAFYWAWKYRDMLGLPGLADVYEYRHALSAVIERWERYGMIFTKFVGGFSLAYVAVTTGKVKYLLGSILIFIMDYMLAGHRASLGFIGVILAAYCWFVVLKQRFYISHVILALAGGSALFSSAILISGRISPYVIAIYDRAFHVTPTLFLQYYEQAHDIGFYRGGDGMLGVLFGGNGQNYRTDIGERFYSPNVSANADIISDAYINFGIIGPLVALIILRLLVSRRDADFFRRNREAVVVFIVPYMLALFSMGLQTALLTGALAFALMLMKLADVSPVRGRFAPFRHLRTT